ncbi:hypothetical protein EAE96_005395 [Botrytis aclada]|nr:hypothetical protein EAE96_005395 [Botrytis aclada]
MRSSNSYARGELPGSRSPGNPLSPIFKQERSNSPALLDEEYYLLNTPREPSETESELFASDNRSHSSKRKGKRNTEMRIPRTRKRNARKTYVEETSDDEKEKLDSILGGAPRSKMQYQDQHTRSRGENVSNAVTTALPSESITMSLDTSTEPHITLTIPAAFKKYHVTIVHDNTTSNYTVNEATTSTLQHAL